MPTRMSPELIAHISASVRGALAEDVGSGDLTAALVPVSQRADATIITRDGAVICGQPWVKEVFRQLDPGIAIECFGVPLRIGCVALLRARCEGAECQQDPEGMGRFHRGVR